MGGGNNHAGSNKVFGQAMKGRKNNGRGGSTRYQRQFGNRGGTGSSHSRINVEKDPEQIKAALFAQKKRAKQAKSNALDRDVGLMEEFVCTNNVNTDSKEEQSKRGWLYNILPTTVTRSDDVGGSAERAGVDLYFYTDGRHNFKTTLLYRPYFYVLPDLESRDETQNEVTLELIRTSLLRLYEDLGLYSVNVVYRMDLDQPNHLSPQRTEGRPVLQLVFDTVAQLMEVREAFSRDILKPNQQRAKESKTNVHTFDFNANATASTNTRAEGHMQCLTEMREYDVPYVVRVLTDLDIRAGTWYTVVLDNDDDAGVRLTDPDRESKANPTVFAFDIECTKAPLKFPSADVDEIFMISYMVTENGKSQGYLIVSRSIVSQDISNFEYTPKPTYPGPFHIFNEPNEKALLERFFKEYRRHCPQIVVTYNGDFFDWPFVEARAQVHGMDMWVETGGVELDSSSTQYRGRSTVHLDAFHWVQRDSYLPQGAQGLKAVTKYKLGYDPVEVDPEDMVPYARDRPVHMATYSVSDAVATWYLYEKYVHLFIFSLSTIIPMGPEDVLSKGSGTLCEALLMVQAFKGEIICPNKQVDEISQFHKGHLLESETYIGGKVECLETGVYRSDVEYDFDLKPSAFDELINNIDRDLIFAIEKEEKKKKEDILNYDQVRAEIVAKLEALRDRPLRKEKPFIYHLDVGAMYPNIILTNRLQPSAIVDDATCAACDFNSAANGCKRRMKWTWRGDFTPASRQEYEQIKEQLAREPARDDLTFNQLPEREQAELVAKRLKVYSQKAYRKTKVTQEQDRNDVVCMRENDFYVSTVRQFRDRRYDFKRYKKDWGKKLSKAKDQTEKKHCEDKVLVYDSLQVAHKCILNSFYGYVMRKGARWRSMQMGGIVTKTGADIITQARILVEQIGRPLELDTDGIWCILPKSFPDKYTFELKGGKSMTLEYPCVMLNADVDANFTNHQYQELVDVKNGHYETKSECSIFFEVDGPYRCMVLPASTEEGKFLKKRYAVFNFDGSLAELKGFELKRRGELELIKTFQEEVFERFLDGNGLEECYDAVASVANYWLDVLDTQGQTLDDEELVGLISENRNMSRQLEDYGDQKGTSQTTARRLGEFLGKDFIKDKGLNCKFIISEKPYGAPVTDRAIPTAIWKAEPPIMKHFLRKWLKSPELDDNDFDIRNILDWDYYLERLGNTIRKIITIPAALQCVPNPVPRVAHPSWLTDKVNKREDKLKQQEITSMFKVGPKKKKAPSTLDIEDIGKTDSTGGKKRALVHRAKRVQPESQPSETKKVALATNNLSDDKFGDWLKQRKSQWRASRRGRLGAGMNDTEKRQRTNVSVEGFVREAAQLRRQSDWHVLEIREMAGYDGNGSAVGEFVLWAMLEDSSLQKVNVSVLRTVLLSSRSELTTELGDIVEFKRVDRILPEGKMPSILYQISMPEHVYRKKNWFANLKTTNDAEQLEDVVEKMYEASTPLKLKALTELGSVIRLKSDRNGKAFSLSDFDRLETPRAGEYLSQSLSYKRLFLYVHISPRTKTGIVALFAINGGSGSFSTKDESGAKTEHDLTRPADMGLSSLDVGGACHIWIVKPSNRNSQRNLSVKQCEGVFGQLVATIQESVGEESDYACIAGSSSIRVSGLNFVKSEELALAGANEAISNVAKSPNGTHLLFVNASCPMASLRRHIPFSTSLPMIEMPFPPGRAHDPSASPLPSLNWEQVGVRLFLEAYLYLVVVSFPKKMSYARHGRIPLGCVSADENVSLYEVSMSRLLRQNRGISWASSASGKADKGLQVQSRLKDGIVCKEGNATSQSYSQDEIWGDDNELLSPVVRCPGTYRAICVDLDVHDLAIAALTSSLGESRLPTEPNPASSPTSVALMSPVVQHQKDAPLGDEMATRFSLSMLKSLTMSWIRDVFDSNSMVADEVLHHIYRIISREENAFHDSALHRVLHSLMKSTFMRLLGELQRLGCTVVHASFQKITVATNKICLEDAEEHIDFIVKTIQGGSNGEHTEALSRVSLKPRQFHSHFLFLDEYNFGTLQLERLSESEVADIEGAIAIKDHANEGVVVVPSVVTAWSMMEYLGSEVAQEYFRAIMGRFSTEPYRKQVDLIPQNSLMLAGAGEAHTELVAFKKEMLSNKFSSYLTRAVGEIMRDHMDDEDADDRPAIAFISSVLAVFELDPDIENQVQALKRSLLSQVGVAEYSVKWENPCPTFMLPDVFCEECSESRDVNLCFSPPGHEDMESPWICEECGAPYNTNSLEERLLDILNRKLVRYQLQDVRCSKTNRIPSRSLVALSECAAPLKTDTSRGSIESEIQLMLELAELRGLESLRDAASDILGSFRS